MGLMSVMVEHPEKPGFEYTCALVGFGGVACGQCGELLPQPVEVGVECGCGCVVSKVDSYGEARDLEV